MFLLSSDSVYCSTPSSGCCSSTTTSWTGEQTNLVVPLAFDNFLSQQLLTLRSPFFLYRFVSRSDFQYVEMDTDSAYMAVSNADMAQLVHKDSQESYYREYGDWFPRPYCEEHESDFHGGRRAQLSNLPDCCLKVYQYDSRTPGLFKEEFRGDGIVALNSKTYFCWQNDGGVKLSSKGLSKFTNQLTKEHYLTVLRSGEQGSGVNRGFARKDNRTYTYEQVKTGLTYFYAKRKVEDDGVSITNIDC